VAVSFDEAGDRQSPVEIDHFGGLADVPRDFAVAAEGKDPVT
jgi:hypothetical protein